MTKEDNRLRCSEEVATPFGLDKDVRANYSPSMYTISYYNGDQYLSFPLYHKYGFYNAKTTLAQGS
jgi:hypothetical protein